MFRDLNIYKPRKAYTFEPNISKIKPIKPIKLMLNNAKLRITFLNIKYLSISGCCLLGHLCDDTLLNVREF